RPSRSRARRLPARPADRRRGPESLSQICAQTAYYLTLRRPERRERAVARAPTAHPAVRHARALTDAAPQRNRGRGRRGAEGATDDVDGRAEQYGALWDIRRDRCAQGRTRTGTALRPTDFKSVASTIPPPGRGVPGKSIEN